MEAALDGELEEVVRALAAFERPSAGPGERRAAEWIAERLRRIGLRDVRLEEEPAHGGYWWPLGLLSLLSAAAALAPRRLIRVLGAALAALGIWDELGLHRGAWTRRFVRRATTTNVVAELGDPGARETVVIIGHHDAAHSGAIFNPTLTYAIGRRFPQLIERARAWPRVMGLVITGPVLVALGLRRLGGLFSLGSAVAFADIGRSEVVAGERQPHRRGRARRGGAGAGGGSAQRHPGGVPVRGRRGVLRGGVAGVLPPPW